MRRRRAIWVMAILGVGFAGFLLVKLLAPAYPDLSEKNIARIKAGMTLKEVEAIIGAPPSNYYTRSDIVLVEIPHPMNPFPQGGEWIEWLNNDGHLYLVIDAQGQVFTTYHTAFPKRTVVRHFRDLFTPTSGRGSPIFIR